MAAEDLASVSRIVPNVQGSDVLQLGDVPLLKLLSVGLDELPANDPKSTSCMMILAIHGMPDGTQKKELITNGGRFHDYSSLYHGHYGKSSNSQKVASKQISDAKKYQDIASARPDAGFLYDSGWSTRIKEGSDDFDDNSDDSAASSEEDDVWTDPLD